MLEPVDADEGLNAPRRPVMTAFCGMPEDPSVLNPLLTDHRRNKLTGCEKVWTVAI